MTLKGEGEKNVILRPDACHRHYKEMCTCVLLVAEGMIQKQPGILNVLA
jgi:hypothetical protein